MQRAKALIMIAMVFSLGVVSVARAEHFGPINSVISAGAFSLGIGYAYNAAEWGNFGPDSNWGLDDTPLEIRQHQAMAEVSLGLGKGWVTSLRGGAANMQINNGMLFTESKFEGKPQPFAEAYFGGPIFRGRVLSVGPFVQGSYTYKFEDTAPASATDPFGVVFVGNETTKIENLWLATTGLTFQLEIEGASLYFGPSYTLGGGDYESEFVGTDSLGVTKSGSFTDVIKPGRHLAGFAGVRWELPTEDWPTEGSKTYLDFEARMTGDLSAGAMLYFTY